MLVLALLLGHAFPPIPVTLALLGLGALGYGISIWLDLLALRDLGATREAVLFSSAPFVGALFSLVVLRETFSASLLLAEHHSHRHRHRHDPRGGEQGLVDPHHERDHAPDDLEGLPAERPFWHAHEHHHREIENAHPHVSVAPHRHRH